MSDEAKIFRGDHDPEQGYVAVPVARMPTPVPAAPKPAAADEPVAQATPEPAPVETEPVAVRAPVVTPKPAPPLHFELDASQLFHTPEAVRQRMAQLATLAHSTAHQLDEQAEASDRIAKRLKSLG
jgi:hypothetical protein